MFHSKRAILRILSMFAVLALFAAGCGGTDDPTSAAEVADGSSAALLAPTPDIPNPNGLLTIEELEAELAAAPTPVPLPTVDPALFSTPVPTPTPEVSKDPWEVHVLTAKSDTVAVPLFDAPDGNTFEMTYQFRDGSSVKYPLENPTYFDNQLALMVIEGEPGDDWAKVQLPTRPNGSTGWVQTGFFDWSTHNYHVDINVTDNWVKVWEGDELVVESSAVTGKEGRRTPVVEAFIDEKVSGLNAAYGPWILSIAAFSNDLNKFSNALPKLALHGTNEPELMGQFASAGCIRVPNDIITLIAETVPVGTPVSIFQ